MTLQISNVAAKAGMDAVTLLLNAGGTGKLRIYSGTKPTDADTALSGNTVLADFALAADAFGDAADANPGAISTAAAISDVNASATGTATFFRLLNNAATCVAQGTVGVSASDCIVTSTSFVSGQPCHVVSLTLTHPE